MRSFAAKIGVAVAVIVAAAAAVYVARRRSPEGVKRSEGAEVASVSEGEVFEGPMAEREAYEANLESIMLSRTTDPTVIQARLAYIRFNMDIAPGSEDERFLNDLARAMDVDPNLSRFTLKSLEGITKNGIDAAYWLYHGSVKGSPDFLPSMADFRLENWFEKMGIGQNDLRAVYLRRPLR